MSKTGVLILAAGKSRRMGSDKRALPWGTSTLLESAIELCHSASLPCCVALSSEPADDHWEAHLRDQNCTVLRVATADSGMGDTLAHCIDHIPPHWEHLIIHLCDMPLITKETLQSLDQALQTAHIVIPTFSEKWGNPRGFNRSLWPQLRSLTGDQGARDIIRTSGARVTTIEVDNAGILTDLDEPEIYRFWYQIDQTQL